MLKRIITNIKRLVEEKNKRGKKSITRKILIQLLNSLNQKIFDETTLHAAYSMTFAAFLRCGEFTYTARKVDSSSFDAWHLIKKSIELQTDRMIIFLPASKINSFRRGIMLTVTVTDDKACAVASMKNLFKRLSAAPNASLFSQSGDVFIREFVTFNLRTAMKQLNIMEIIQDISSKRTRQHRRRKPAYQKSTFKC